MKKKNRRLSVLMITSQLLLTLFVIYWLTSQYRSEKESLTDELASFYVRTHDEMIDTLIFRSYVGPMLKVRKNGQARLKTPAPEVFINDTTLAGKEHDDLRSVQLKGEKTITVRINHVPDSINRSTVRSWEGSLPEEMLVRSVRLFVAHSEDSTDNSSPSIAQLALDIDTATFRDHFFHMMHNAGMNFVFNWSDSGAILGKKDDMKHIILGALPGTCIQEASISGFNGYLFRKILPQIIFGSVLVFLTALAFMVSYRSIRDHMILNDMRNEFIANITHELKTPVATLSVVLESLGRYNMKDDPRLVDDYLRLASAETRRLEELINRILDHSLLEDNSQALNIIRTDIVGMIVEIAETMRQRAGKGSITVRAKERDIPVMCDPLFLKGVIINLIDNGIRYCDKEPVIIINAYKKDNTAVIEINDNGPGIPEEYHDKIFEKFFRVPTGNVHNVKGYGLGLSFASLVMALHRGSIEVHNLDPGCSFTLKIPLA